MMTSHLLPLSLTYRVTESLVATKFSWTSTHSLRQMSRSLVSAVPEFCLPEAVWLLLLVGGTEGCMPLRPAVFSSDCFISLFLYNTAKTTRLPASLHGSSPPAPVGPEGNLLTAWHLAAHMDKQTDDWLAKDWVVKPSLFSSHSSSCAVAFLAVISGSWTQWHLELTLSSSGTKHIHFLAMHKDQFTSKKEACMPTFKLNFIFKLLLTVQRT